MLWRWIRNVMWWWWWDGDVMTWLYGGSLAHGKTSHLDWTNFEPACNLHKCCLDIKCFRWYVSKQFPIYISSRCGRTWASRWCSSPHLINENPIFNLAQIKNKNIVFSLKNSLKFATGMDVYTHFKADGLLLPFVVVPFWTRINR